LSKKKLKKKLKKKTYTYYLLKLTQNKEGKKIGATTPCSLKHPVEPK
jgi:hypothetical protein